jgi:hypothetical protein
MPAPVSLPPDASARLAMLAQMLERSTSKPDADSGSEGSRREGSCGESSSPRKS